MNRTAHGGTITVNRLEVVSTAGSLFKQYITHDERKRIKWSQGGGQGRISTTSAFVKGKVDGRKKAISFRDPVISTGNGMNPLSVVSLNRFHS